MSSRLGIVLSALLLAASHSAHAGDHTGQLLVATPEMGDPRFAGAVIYVCIDEEKGAFGLVLNKPAGDMTLDKVMELFKLKIPVSAPDKVEVRLGGPVEQDRGYLVHSDDFTSRGALCHENGIEVTASRDVLEAMAAGKGPGRTVLFIGYAGWGPGQLASEISDGDWEAVPADPRLVLEGDLSTLWSRAMKRRGTDL
jgi:putative transcriptional regulator